MPSKYDVKGEDATRERITIILIYALSIMMAMALGITGILIYTQRLEADNAVTIILAVSNVFSIFVGSAIGYYFSSKK